jgi:antitoxin component YwqK of YwqJK toxin-antitoxin module
LGTVVNAAVGLTGLAMAIAGNDHPIPAQNNSNIFGQNDNGTNMYQSREESYNEKMKFEEEKRLISKNLNSISKPTIKEDSTPEKEVIENGIYEDFYNNSNLRTRGNYTNGKKIGLWEEWYENGKLKSRMEYLEGKKIGRLDTYHPNGQLKGRVNYVDGKEDGEIMVYNENGEILLIGIFKEGMQAGEWNYFENGKLIKTENFD